MRQSGDDLAQHCLQRFVGWGGYFAEDRFAFGAAPVHAVRLRLLTVTSKAGLALAPDIPTTGETGFPGDRGAEPTRPRDAKIEPECVAAAQTAALRTSDHAQRLLIRPTKI